jgi:hypothetical protein
MSFASKSAQILSDETIFPGYSEYNVTQRLELLVLNVLFLSSHSYFNRLEQEMIKMDLRKIGWDGRDWIDLAQNRDQWRALVNTAMNLRVP